MEPDDRHRREYEVRVNRVIDHIQRHRAEDLPLEELARIAAFSPYHFHRVWKAITGENVGAYVQRVRLEWAASTLLARPDDDITAIALDAGFGSATAFGRAFKERFGMTATAWRDGGGAAWSKTRRADRKLDGSDRNGGGAVAGALGHGEANEAEVRPEEPIMNVTVTSLPAYRIAYLRHTGPYGAAGQIPELWARLRRWAAARDLWTADRLCLGIAHDDPCVTAPEQCRYDAGIVLPDGFEPDRQVNVATVGGGKHALVPFEGTARDIGEAWDRLFRRWLPESGYRPGDAPLLELYRGEAFDEVRGVVRCDLATPVAAL